MAMAAAIAAVAPAALSAADDQPPPLKHDPLLDLSLDQLSSLEVNSVAGIAMDWFQTPAELHVISNEEIRRSGHQTLAEALRLVPGLFVGRADANTWSIGARGFNGGLGNKSLVLIDGRTVYDPLFSGTFWEVQDVLLEDIDQIEVINGPGATLWGANAVNGVISVTTRSAKQTQGLYLSGSVGVHERGIGAVRYGGRASENSWFRIWGKFANHDDMRNAAGDSADDDWDMARGGIRFDIEGSDQTTLTIQSEIYGSDRIGERVFNQAVPNAHVQFVTTSQDGRAEGAHLLARLTRDTGPDAGWSLQGYYDRTERVLTNGFEVSRDTFDLDFRHHFTLADHHSFIWGAAVRHTADRTHAGPNLAYDPRSRSMDTFSGFIQHTFAVVPERFFTMVGSKFEHNDVTGFEVQPSVRAWFTPDDRQTLWAGISRAVRVPSRTEDDAIVTIAIADEGLLAGGPASGTFIPLTTAGNNRSASEVLTAYEAGYRLKPADNLTLDMSVFYHDYSRLLNLPATLFGLFEDRGSGESYGATVTLNLRLADNWRLFAAYSYTDVQVHGPILNVDESGTPHNMAQLRSYLDITEDLELNAALYYVDEVAAGTVKAHLRFDLGVTWRPTDNFEISVWGQNLADPVHNDFSSFQIRRGVVIQAAFRF